MPKPVDSGKAASGPEQQTATSGRPSGDERATGQAQRDTFGADNPLGRILRAEKKTYEVIGVARNSKSRTIRESPALCAYLYLEGDPEEVMSLFGISLVAKTTVPPRSLVRSVRDEISRLDGNLAVFNVETMREHVDRSLLVPKMCAVLLGLFGAAGLVLASVGLYGVMSYAVRSRVRMITTQGMALAALGLALGLAIALALTRFAASFLYGISTTDAFTFVAVPLVLLGTAVLAVLIPARRAAHVDPTHALRCE